MAAPTPVITTLSDTNESVILKVAVPSGGDTDITSTLFADVSTYTTGATGNNLNIMRVQWSSDFSFEILFDANTDDLALSLCRGSGDLDFSALAHGIKNPRSASVTGDINFLTRGLADTEDDVKDCGFFIIYLEKNTV